MIIFLHSRRQSRVVPPESTWNKMPCLVFLSVNQFQTLSKPLTDEGFIYYSIIQVYGKLAREPSALTRVLIATPAVYPRLVVNYEFDIFSLKDPLNLESQNQSILLFSRVPQSKFETIRSRNSWVMIGHTKNKQTD